MEPTLTEQAERLKQQTTAMMGVPEPIREAVVRFCENVIKAQKSKPAKTEPVK